MIVCRPVWSPTDIQVCAVVDVENIRTAPKAFGQHTNTTEPAPSLSTSYKIILVLGICWMSKLGQVKGILLQSAKEKQIPEPGSEENSPGE